MIGSAETILEPIPEEPAGEGPRRTFWTRLGFAWFVVVALLSTIPSSILQLVSHQFSPTARNFKRCASLWSRTILAGCGIQVRVTDELGLDPERPYVFVSNHQNLVDILVLAAALPYPFGFVAKAELERVPFLGFAVRNSASVYIDRSEPRRAVESLKEAGERIRGGNSVLIFAEGARSYAPRLLPFKRGAFAVAVEAGVPLVPVTIVDAYHVMDERRRTCRPGTVHVIVGEPIAMEGLHRRDIPQVVDQVKARIAADLAAAHPGRTIDQSE